VRRGDFISSSQERGSSARHDQVVPVRIKDFYFKRGAWKWTPGLRKRRWLKWGEAAGSRGVGTATTQTCRRIQQLCWPGRHHQTSPGSFKDLVSSIPSWNTDQGVHRSWECCGVETSNTKWKWNEREEGVTFLCIFSRIRFFWQFWAKLITIQPERWWSKNDENEAWWKSGGGSTGVLTCKSMLTVVFRGEIPIEPFSCWFSSKFPPG